MEGISGRPWPALEHFSLNIKSRSGNCNFCSNLTHSDTKVSDLEIKHIHQTSDTSYYIPQLATQRESPTHSRWACRSAAGWSWRLRWTWPARGSSPRSCRARSPGNLSCRKCRYPGKYSLEVNTVIFLGMDFFYTYLYYKLGYFVSQ